MYLFEVYDNIYLVINMKKTLSIIISILIVLLSFSTISFATDTVTLSLQNETVYAGDEFTVNLFISDNSKVSGAVVDINYDKSKLEFVSAKEGAILDTKASISIRNINNDNSYVRFAYMANGSCITAEGILFSVTFKVLETAEGKTDLNISIPSPADFVSENIEKIPYSVHNSTITIINDIDNEITSESETEIPESTTDEITETESQITTETDNNPDDKKEDGDSYLSIILVLIGVAFICFGFALAIKKKRS